MMNLAKVLALLGAIVSFPMCALMFQANETGTISTKFEKLCYLFVRYGTMALPAVATVFAIFVGVEL